MKISQFHDWTLAELLFDWAQARVTVILEGPESARRELVASEVSFLEVPRENPWGKSISVNSLHSSDSAGREGQPLEIELEMRSGGVIRISARKFEV